MKVLWKIQHSQYNKIGYEGAIAIAEALKINNTLTTLYLHVRVFILTNKCEKDFMELNIHRTMKLEVKEQLKLQEH